MAVTDLDAALQSARAEFTRLNDARLDCELDGKRWPTRLYRQLHAARDKVAKLTRRQVEII